MTMQYNSRTISMLDVHFALSSLLWGVVVLLPPNNLFHNYLTLVQMGRWGVNEFLSGFIAITGGVCHAYIIFKGSYRIRRWLLTFGCAWWTFVTVAASHTSPLLPVVGFYLATAIMCGVQAVRAKHHQPGVLINE